LFAASTLRPSCLAASRRRFLLFMSLSPASPAYQLRPAERADADFLWQLRQAAMRETVEKNWGKWDDTEQRQFFDRGFVPRQTAVILVDGRPVGRLDVNRSRMEFFLGIIELLPEVQGRGLGSAVIRDLLEEARAEQVPVRLQLIKSNTAALRLYERLGFKRSGETTTHQLMLWQP
jgi:ribosomal protein S18 acetylase RimI-like enzyme